MAENLAINTLLEQQHRIVNWKDVKRIAFQALTQIDISLDLNDLVANHSVAEKQLVAISRALLHEARLIVMDEPTTALTQKEINRLFEVIKKLQQENISVLFVSHKLNEIMEISERITVLRNGKVVAEGEAGDFTQQDLAYYMTGRKLTEMHHTFHAADSETERLLQVVKLSKSGTYHNINFDLQAGEVIGFTGLLGSGRTELARSLFGVDSFDSGQIFLKNKQIEIKSVQDAMCHGIAYLPEDRLTEGLFLAQSIEKNIVVTVVSKLLSKLKLVNKQEANHISKTWIDTLNIDAPSPRMAVQWLSGGNQQKTVLAKWLAAQARILILNGPTVGVDIGAKMDIHQKIRDLAKDGMGIIVISDDIPELMQTCNRVYLMHQGQLIYEYHTEQCDDSVLIEHMRRLD